MTPLLMPSPDKALSKSRLEPIAGRLTLAHFFFTATTWVQDDPGLHRGQSGRLGLRTRVAVVNCTGQGAKFLRGLQLLPQRRVNLHVPLQRAKGRAESGL